jgi:hypothetical protein
MKIYLFKIYVIILLSTISTISNGQGCSDGGVCTLNNFKPGDGNSESHRHNYLKLGIGYGGADHNITIVAPYVEYWRKISDKFDLSIKLTSIAQNGNEISEFGLSDIYLAGNFNLSENLKLTLGTKIPLSDGNTTKNSLALPMDYQSSLGTFDLLLGLAYQVQNLHFVVAYQQPLSQNKNTFLATDYPLDSELRTYQSTNMYQRNGDILLRASYFIPMGSQFSLTPSILPIYHLANDKFTDNTGLEQEIVGSSGLTLNVNAYIDYQINASNSLQFNLGVPIIVREARPDGLTRHFILNLEYKITF